MRRWPGREGRGPVQETRRRRLLPMASDLMLEEKKVGEPGTGLSKNRSSMRQACGSPRTLHEAPAEGRLESQPSLMGHCQFLRERAEMEPTDNILEKWPHLTEERTESPLGRLFPLVLLCLPAPRHSGRHREGDRQESALRLPALTALQDSGWRGHKAGNRAC